MYSVWYVLSNVRNVVNNYDFWTKPILIYVIIDMDTVYGCSYF